MKLYKYSLLALMVFIATLMSCEDFLETKPNSSVPSETALISKNYFLGFLYKSYSALPDRINFEYEAATDNAVVNRENFNPSKAAKGGISTQNNPLGDSWEDNYFNINSINWFLDKMVIDPDTSKAIRTPVRFDRNESVNFQIFHRTKGEAFFLRAWFQFELLKKYGGVASDGKAYGFPIITDYLEYTDNLDLPRNTYEECVAQIARDCDSAAALLPLIYASGIGQIEDGLTDDAGRASGIAALALKARALLFLASPAYNVNNNQTYWVSAVQAARDAIDSIGDDGLLAYSAYFNKNNLNDAKYNNKDLFFRGEIKKDNQTLEKENYPPRAFGGNGKYNPTQNLVDAFPMADGYPRGASPFLLYDANAQFTNRDPRLELFILHDQEQFRDLTMETTLGGADAFGSAQNATRTGYYLQKWLDAAVSLEPGKLVKTTKAAYLLGRAELYLNFAEAAVNATGNPDDAQYGYSAREILEKVRSRALGAGNDLYLPTITTKEDFLNVVKNERRVELCFEDFRFWDIRRWSIEADDKSLIGVPAYGIYSADPVEKRDYKSAYMPLPYSEIVKTNNLVNNKGW